MLTRRTLLKLGSLSLFSHNIPDVWSAPIARLRALVVGIDKYVMAASSLIETKAEGGGASAAAIQRNRRFIDLDGAVNDATLIYQILKDRFDFLPEDIVFLKNQDATRDAILREFQIHLVNAASPNDISLFYFAGHGSQVQNLASDEPDQLDETIVPANSYAGVPDIRDKEMARLYRAALRKGVRLTVILDSCHSGGMARGGWNVTGKTRNLLPGSRPVNDPPDRDPVTGMKLPDATSMGMLFLAAARKDQPAGETTVMERSADGTEKEVAHGAFTAALVRVLESSIANQSIEQICDRVQAMLASEGRMQLPICAGNERDSRGLLGQSLGLVQSITLTVERVTHEGVVRLLGGSALGLAAGCILTRTSGPPARIKLDRVELGISEARSLSGLTVGAVRVGDIFKLETWVAPPASAIKVYLPADGPDADAVAAVAGVVNRLATQKGVEVLSDLHPGISPTHVLYWRDGCCHVERYPADGKIVRLSSLPTIEDITNALGNVEGVRLWPILPPDNRLIAEIRLGAGTENQVVRVVDNPAECIYFLAGRLNRGTVEYSWVYKDLFLADPNQARLPLKTDWKTSGEQITNLALRLARIYAWLNLNSPAGGDAVFPYRLVFEKAGKREPVGEGPFKFGERYKFVFQATPEALKQSSSAGGIAKRYVYVFLIDSNGDATCFFPNPANGNDGNLIPQDDSASPRIEATLSEYDVEICEPAGTDNYFLIASEQPIDPEIFKWTGVRGHEERRGSENPIEFLFSSVGETVRGVHPGHSVPVTWQIQSIAVHSIP